MSALLRYYLRLPLTLFLLLAVPLTAVFAQGNGEAGTETPGHGFKGRVVSVDAGDLVTVRLDAWDVKVRLHGVAVPTEDARLMERARQFTALRVGDTTVRVQVRGTGTKETVYGEVITALNDTLNGELISVGLARWAGEYAPDRTDLAARETRASDLRLGLWSDPSGANVALPPSTVETLRARSTPAPTSTPSPIITPAAAPPAPNNGGVLPSPQGTLTPTPTPSPEEEGEVSDSPVSAPVFVPVSAEAAAPVEGVGLSDIALFVFTFTFSAALILLARASEWSAKCLPAQIAVSAAVAAAMTLLMPLPVWLLQQGGSVAGAGEKPALWIAAVTAPLALLLGSYGLSLSRGAQLLRGTPRQALGEAEPGFVHVSGGTRAPAGCVYSVAGKIPGLYIREITSKCETMPNNRREVHWVTVSDDTQIAEFMLDDETGEAMIDGARAAFYPASVARFYDGIPLEEWHKNPYPGDIRTEIFFISPGAHLSVWGRLYHTAAPLAEDKEARLGFDAATGCFVITETEDAFKRLPLRHARIGILLFLAALLFTIVTAACVFAPRVFEAGG